MKNDLVCQLNIDHKMWGPVPMCVWLEYYLLRIEMLHLC